MQCPKCQRTVAAVPGATRIQCFGCGTIIETSGSKAASMPSPNTGAKSSGANLPLILLGLFIGVLAIVVLGGIVFFAVTPSTIETQTPPASAPTPTPEEMVPAYTATDAERELAATVAESARNQIIQMWDQMRATTGKKLLAPKGSVIRNRVEDMLSGIEQRELQNMSALLQVDLDAVKAVVQVHMAEQAEKALLESQQSSS
jgi:flagellar basal body-associated protein FliL